MQENPEARRQPQLEQLLAMAELAPKQHLAQVQSRLLGLG